MAADATRPHAPGARTLTTVTTTTTASATTLALKEQGAAVHALLDGRQTLLLRKGGIREKRFEVGADRFVVFPTVAHTHADRVRPEHRELVARGAADVDEQAGTFVVRCGVELVDVVEVARPEHLPALAGQHIWTDESVRRDRLEFRPKHALQVLVVRAVALPRAVVIRRLPEHGGCSSWTDVDLGAPWAGEGVAVHDDATLTAVARGVRAAVG